MKWWLVLLAVLGFGCGATTEYDLVLRNGTIYDGSGRAPVVADVAIQGDKIAAVGQFDAARGRATSSTTSSGRRSAAISNTSSGAGFRATSRRSSAPPRPAST